MVPSLHLSHLAGGVPALTQSILNTLAEAACVALSMHGHENPVTLHVSGGKQQNYSLHSFAVTDAMRRTYADAVECTEFGACGVAILLVLAETNYTVVQRSYIGTGYDYRLGQKDDFLFQQTARLEVSGIGAGNEQEVKQRTRQKIAQTSISDNTNLPAVVVVVEFSTPMAEVTYRNAA